MTSKIAIALFTFLFSAAPLLAGPQIEMFSPQGMVKQVRQVSVRFPEPMVPFGDPRGLVEPFKIDCPAKGTPRWADTKNWIFDFEQDLPAGIKCEFTLSEGLKTLSGKEVSGQRKYLFSTGGPSVRASNPYQGGQVSEDQIFILTLDAEPDQPTVLDNVSFSVDGIPQHIGIRIVSAPEKDRLIKATTNRFGWNREEDAAKKQQPPVLLIQAKQHFPTDTRVALIWGKGVTTKTGVATEQDQVLNFKTRPAFTANFNCERVNAQEGCLPFAPMFLQFSAPISWSQAKKIVLVKGQKKWRPKKPKQEEDEEGGEAITGNFVQNVSFEGPFPAQTDFRIELPPQGLVDDSGRLLVNAEKFPLTVRTGEFPPLAKFAARFGILELKAEPVLPFTVRNIEPQVKTKLLKVDQEPEGMKGWIEKVKGRLFKVSSTEKVGQYLFWLDQVHKYENEWNTSIFSQANRGPVKDFTVPKPNGAKAFEVIGLPLKEPGLYVIELESQILGQSLRQKSEPMFVPTAALVTNLSVHLKWGRESSIVWVTTLDKGQPAVGADVTVSDCQGNALWTGRTDGNGLARVTALPDADKLPECTNYKGPMRATKLFVSAKLGDDFSFVLDNWAEGIEPWRFQVPYEYVQAAVKNIHSVFDRTLLRAGETVHMKHILRKQTMDGFSVPSAEDFPKTVVIQHLGSDQNYELPVQFDTNGIAETTWDIPKEAKLGMYSLTFKEAPEPENNKPNQPSRHHQHRWGGGWGSSGGFRVEEFRVPLMRAMIRPPTDPLIGAQSVPVDLSVAYLSGGGAENLPVKFRSQTQPRHMATFDAFEGYVFANGPPQERLQRPGAKPQEPELQTVELNLDRTGNGHTVVENLPTIKAPTDLIGELEFRDPNGEVQTVSTRIPLWPSEYLVGIKPDSWAMSKKSFKTFIAVADLSGKPVAGVSVSVSLLERKTYSHRKRLVGGFYSYDHSEKIVRLGAICPGRTDNKGILVCEAPSPVSGNVIVQAAVKDNAGRASVAHSDMWIAGEGDWWFAVGDSDRMDVLPEKKRYEPGQMASFQVRMPFKEATALVTVEREGVVDAFIRKLSRNNPIVKIPVKGDYAPNVFISVLAVRGRVGEVRPTALVDLGRPAFRLGIGEISVGWKAHELKVSVTSDKEVYKVRDKAQVKLKVATVDGKALPAGAEAAIAAVDEGLLELMPNKSWNLLDGMMGRRGLAVKTATVQMHVIGKRHFGLKALPQGGGGGKQTTRELFDTLLFWKARVPLNSNGEATVEVPLNDSITSFRIEAVAHAGPGLFGNGGTSIRSTQDLIILSGLAPVVREGDRYQAHFTLRNTTARALELDVTGKAEGLAQPLNSIPLSLGPNQAKEISWDVEVPFGINSLNYEIIARDKSGAEDRIKVAQKVVAAVPVRPFQATLSQVDGSLQMPVERPADALPGRGGVKVSFRPTLASGLTGITDYMEAYPYDCLEQRISKAITLNDQAAWNKMIAQLPSYLDSDGLAKYFPTMTYGCDCLTSYLIAIADEAGWSIPENLKTRMSEGLTKFVEGKIIRNSALPTADLTIRKLSAVEALSRSGRINPGLISSISVEPNLWPTSAVIDWLNILKRVEQAPMRPQRMMEAEQILRSRLNFQGTTMGFSTEKSDDLWWLMVSNDVNAVRMILSHLDSPEWKEDMPRLIRGAIGRQHQGHWDLTIANAWGRLSLEKFSKAFEQVPVSGASNVMLAGDTKKVDWNVTPQGDTVSLPWPSGSEKVSIQHNGNGKPWATVSSLAAIPLKEPFSTGYRIKKTWIPVQQKRPGSWSRGDVARVHLELEAQADMTWVVVNDPIPAGASILGTGLGRDSQLAMRGQKDTGWVWPAFEERSFEAFRSYYEYVPKGPWTVEYTLRLNNDGVFHLPPTRTEAMYSPEMLGELPNDAIEVQR